LTLARSFWSSVRNLKSPVTVTAGEIILVLAMAAPFDVSLLYSISDPPIIMPGLKVKYFSVLRVSLN
jgi:hypothetical protein